jgi:hypothetical protein
MQAAMVPLSTVVVPVGHTAQTWSVVVVPAVATYWLSSAVQGVYGAQALPGVALNELTHGVHIEAPARLPVPAGQGVHMASLFAVAVNVLAGQGPHV